MPPPIRELPCQNRPEARHCTDGFPLDVPCGLDPEGSKRQFATIPNAVDSRACDLLRLQVLAKLQLPLPAFQASQHLALHIREGTAIEPLAERHAVELFEQRLVEALGYAIGLRASRLGARVVVEWIRRSENDLGRESNKWACGGRSRWPVLMDRRGRTTRGAGR